MTVKKDLEKALAAAQSAEGTYQTFSASTDDQTAKQMYQQMSQDMKRHISTLESRISSTAENQMNEAATSSTNSTSSTSSASSASSTANQQEYLQ